MDDRKIGKISRTDNGHKLKYLGNDIYECIVKGKKETCKISNDGETIGYCAFLFEDAD